MNGICTCCVILINLFIKRPHESEEGFEIFFLKYLYSGLKIRFNPLIYAFASCLGNLN
jgi:hypothetical protein